MTPHQQLKHFKLLIPAKGGLFHDRIMQSRIRRGIDHSKHLLQDRIVFSFLGYRSVVGEGASIREITRETKLHSKTVGKSLNHLGDLVCRKGTKWFAKEPPDGCFIPTWDDDHWYHRLAYVTLYLPRAGAKFQCAGRLRRFGINHSVVYSQLLSLAKKAKISRFTVRGLSTLLDGLSEKTIQTVLLDLQHIGLIRWSQAEIELTPLSGDLIALFDARQDRDKHSSPPIRKERPARPDLHEYEFANDGLDEYRRHCLGLMPQADAEAAISKARRLKYDAITFLCEIDKWRKQNDQNIIDGKVGCPNFGRYLNKILQGRVEKLDEKEQALAAAMEAEAFRKTPEGKKREVEARKTIAADPMHVDHLVDVHSIISRVRFDDNQLKNWQAAQKIIDKVGGHCHRFFSDKTDDVQFVVAETGNLRSRILKSALSALNGFYQQETLATEDQLKLAINEAIIGVTKWNLPRLFEEVTNGKEVAHV